MSDTGNPPVEGQAEGAETKATGRIDAFVFERPEAGILEGRSVSLHHIEVRIFSPRQVEFELRCAGRRFNSCKLRRGAMSGSIEE
jgi:hypothetical protein